jgi:NAD(P)-dependent dehydrogenase (short-subunit alcohol dehydrogenase family)
MVVRLDGQVIVVTGSTQGLGETIAYHVAESGATGIVICGRNSSKGKIVAKKLSAAGCACEFVQANLAIEADCHRVIAACDSRFGRVNGLVNAAGITSRACLESTSIELWDHLFSVNVRAPFILTKKVAQIMKRNNITGSIVNIITISSHAGQPYLTAYCASKGALATFTKNVAHALRYNRIRVNGINIGWTDTPNEHAMQKAAGKPDNWLETAEAEQPFGRLLKPLDVAKLTAYLLSSDAEMMTGSLIDFDQNVIGAYD